MTFTCVSQYILGVRPDYDGLIVDPCIPSSWDGFDITRKFRGATYQIKVTNPNKVQKGIKKLIVDGKEVAGNIIPIMPKGKTYKVEVIMG